MFPYSTDSTNYYQYFLTDHLGNTRITFDTPNDTLKVEQQDDYLPFGMEISKLNTANPKNEYLYNKKELQENTQLYDYGARFYDPVIAIWTTVDPLAEKSRRFSPYVYGKDSPIIMVDPDGMYDQYFGTNGQYLGMDEKGDNGRVGIVTDKASISTLKANNKAGTITNSSSITTAVSTTKTVLKEALNVLDRTNANGGNKEESSTVKANGTATQNPSGSATTKMIGDQEVATSSLTVPGGADNTSIHSHITAITSNPDGGVSASDATQPGPEDSDTFRSFGENIIVGNLGLPSVDKDALGKVTVTKPGQGAAFFDSNSKKQAEVSENALKKIVKTQ